MTWLLEAYRSAAARLGLERRPTVEKALERLVEGGMVLLRAPTAYGKSLMSVALGLAVHEELWERGLARVVHSLPMASIVEDIYRRALSLLLYRVTEMGVGLDGLEAGFEDRYGWRWVGYQAWTLNTDFKDPLYMRSSLAYTTFDSLTLNLFKVTPLRARRAPYESARAAIMRSITVLDEAHLLAEPGEARGLTSLIGVARSLRDLRVPLLVATATVPNRLVEVLRHFVGDFPVITSLPEECNYSGMRGETPIHDYKPGAR